MPINSVQFCVLCLCSWLLPAFVPQGQVQRELAPPAKSDTYSVADDGTKMRVQHREVASTNFRISGVDLTSENDVLSQAARIFGKSAIKSTGDAAYSDSRACYESANEGDNTHIIFGEGELDYYFVVSAGSSALRENQVCTKSGKITRGLRTDSGLRLGLTKQRVIDVLGLATGRTENARQHLETLIYSLEARKKTDREELSRLWQQHRDMSRDAFLENYKFYELEVWISARFISNSLTRLEVSWSAQD